MGMVFFNLIIITFLKDISANETQVRELLYKNPIPTMINIVLLAPILEELIFRKSLAPILKNRWVYVIISGLLFGSAHIAINDGTNNKLTKHRKQIIRFTIYFLSFDEQKNLHFLLLVLSISFT